MTVVSENSLSSSNTKLSYEIFLICLMINATQEIFGHLLIRKLSCIARNILENFWTCGRELWGGGPRCLGYPLNGGKP